MTTYLGSFNITSSRPTKRGVSGRENSRASVCVSQGQALARRFITTICGACVASLALAGDPLLRAFAVALRLLRGTSLAMIRTEPEWKFPPPDHRSCPVGTHPLRQAFSRRTRNTDAVRSGVWKLALAICGLMLATPARAADLPEFTPPPDQRATALANPAELLATMANQLD